PVLPSHAQRLGKHGEIGAGSRSSNASSGARTRPWPRARRCRCWKETVPTSTLYSRGGKVSKAYIRKDKDFMDYGPIEIEGLGVFRGPAVDLDSGEFGVFLGAGQTFGRFVERPF